MLIASRSRSGKSVVMSDLSLQELSAETYTAVFDYLHSDIDKFVLFDSVEAAQEVAYALRAGWDGCTGVEIPDFDSVALKLAASLAGGQWCKVGDSELTTEERRSFDSQYESLRLSIVNSGNGAYFDVRTLDLNLLALPNIAEISFPIGRAEVYWAIALHQESADDTSALSAADITRVTGYSKSTVKGHLSALEKAGAIRCVGRPKRYTVAEACPQEYLVQLESCESLARSMQRTRR